jgi:aryl-alcohol dehydrogenase-like predicted oxidoreductase
LAWVLAQGDDVVPIPGTKRRTYLLENIAAADLVLSDEDLVLLDQALPVGVAHGERYPEQTMAAIDR